MNTRKRGRVWADNQTPSASSEEIPELSTGRKALLLLPLPLAFPLLLTLLLSTSCLYAVQPPLHFQGRDYVATVPPGPIRGVVVFLRRQPKNHPNFFTASPSTPGLKSKQGFTLWHSRQRSVATSSSSPSDNGPAPNSAAGRRCPQARPTTSRLLRREFPTSNGWWSASSGKSERADSNGRSSASPTAASFYSGQSKEGCCRAGPGSASSLAARSVCQRRRRCRRGGRPCSWRASPMTSSRVRA